MTAATPVAAAVYVVAPVDRFLPTIVSLRAAAPEAAVHIGYAGDTDELAELAEAGGATVHQAHSPADLVRTVRAATHGHVLAIDDAVVLPPDFLGPALEMIEADWRVATVSFLSNAGGILSFPYRDTEIPRDNGYTEATLTERLRGLPEQVRFAPIAHAAGKAVLFGSYAFSALQGPVDVPGGRLEGAAVEFSLRGRMRGFVDLADLSTYYARPSDISTFGRQCFIEEHEWLWINHRHRQSSPLIDSDRGRDDTPLALCFRAARARAVGLRVLVDGTCLGPLEMGTQVQTLSLIDALTRRPDVMSVAVSLLGPVPAYAERILSERKVDARYCPDDDLSVFGEVDVAHRPFQPDRLIDLGSWRKTAARTVVTIQDLINFHVTPYHQDFNAFTTYRLNLAATLQQADALVVISEDTRRSVGLEQLPVDAERVFVVPNGTDHLHGDEAGTPPMPLANGPAGIGPFLLVIGANYGHKNRDLAIEAWRELRRRGLQYTLVLVGAAVPHGSSRVREARAGLVAGEADLFVLPDVESGERNWLLRHAAAVLYPTSAEGFGLVPHEAARFGTPTVLVPFGPLAEVTPDLPVGAEDWAPESLADATHSLLSDPALARAQVDAVLTAGPRYTWDRTAAGLVDAYANVLARPAR